MSADSPRETFLAVAEIAARLRVNQQTVRNWIDKRALPAVRVGRRVRVRQSDLDRYLALGATSAGTARTGTQPCASAGSTARLAGACSSAKHRREAVARIDCRFDLHHPGAYATSREISECLIQAD